MPPIDQGLLDRIQEKLGISQSRAYARIGHIASRDMLDRHLAALVLAAESGINIQRYSTAEQRAQIRSARNRTEPARSDVAQAPAQSMRRKGSKKLEKRSRAKGNLIFVVHGRNEALRKSMFDFLRALGLTPMEWSKAVLAAKGPNPHIGEILDAAMDRGRAVVVMFSPDDDAKLRDEFCARGEKRTEGKLQGQPRPNVIFEAGLAYGRHPEKTLLVQIGKVRGFTDIAGRHIIRLSNDADKRIDFANRLEKIGCAVDTQGTDWLKAGDFVA